MEVEAASEAGASMGAEAAFMEAEAASTEVGGFHGGGGGFHGGGGGFHAGFGGFHGAGFGGFHRAFGGTSTLPSAVASHPAFGAASIQPWVVGSHSARGGEFRPGNRFNHRSLPIAFTTDDFSARPSMLIPIRMITDTITNIPTLPIWDIAT